MIAVLMTTLSTAYAAPPPVSIPASTDEAQIGQTPTEGPLGFLNGISRSIELLGNMWGLRTGLSSHGISLAMQETSEYLGNMSGGVKKGFVYMA
ncbi:MAG: hypothetical protein H7240_03540 [Glaciimonas sp.]|nr:hypothetical protein [Glaciimonas sp.]